MGMKAILIRNLYRGIQGRCPLSAYNDNLNNLPPLIQAERLSPALGVDACTLQDFSSLGSLPAHPAG